MVDEENKEQGAIDAECAVEADCNAHPRAEAEEVMPVEPAVQVGEKFGDDLSMVELVPQPEIEAAAMPSNVEAEHDLNVSVTEAEALHDIETHKSPDAAEPAPQVSLAEEDIVGQEADVDLDEIHVAESYVPTSSDSTDSGNNAEMVSSAEHDAAASDTEQKKRGTNSGIALPSFIDRSETGVFGSVGTKTGIPLPPRADDEPKDNDEKAANAVTPIADEQLHEQQYTVISKHEEVEEIKETEGEYSELRSEFSDEDDQYTQAGVDYTQTEVEEPQEELLSARQLGTALTENNLLSFDPLASLTNYPHLYTALLDVKGVWQSSVSMDELIVAAARAEQSDRRNEEIKSWYAMRIKKLVVNVLDFIWIAHAYNMDENGSLVIDDEQLFTSLTGVNASDFKELCSRGFINRNNFIALVRQFKLWEAETFSPADYILVHLRRERMVA